MDMKVRLPTFSPNPLAQGFPEKFKWAELAHAAKYRLIGNAVSPAVARILADFVKLTLGEETNENRLGISA